ncbi:MAG TPA: hypothetical protein DCE41_02405, partial [Cytophagales bacterium]|nr:hypothetical protein [Cytophagales bacterium]
MYKQLYKRTPAGELLLHIFPTEGSFDSPIPVVVFFHPGGWTSLSPEFFYPQCRNLAQQGMVCISVQYRLANGGDITPVHSMEDAEDALRWIAHHAVDLGIDPNRIGLLGYSAGGHLALMAQLRGREGVPMAKEIILYAPPAIFSSTDLVSSPADLDTLSPERHLRQIPGHIHWFHGTADDIVPFAEAEHWVAKAQELGQAVILYDFPGVGHVLLSDSRALPVI